MYHGQGSSNLKRPPTPPRYRMSKQYHRLNISFGISNPKMSTSFAPSPGRSPTQSPEEAPPSPSQQRHTAIGSFSRSPHNHNFTHSANLHPAKHRNKVQQMGLKREMEHVVSGFPKRKQKSGEQQLLKLLMKFNRHPSQDMSPSHRKTPLFELKPQAKSVMIPKLKTRTRYNWSKDRYCANRDKELSPENAQDRLTPKMSALRRTIMKQRLLLE